MGKPEPMRGAWRGVIVATFMSAACLDIPEEAPGFDSADAATAGGPVSTSACDLLFGSAPEYTLCGESAGSCEFATEDPDDADFVCRDICGSRQCLTGYDSDNLSCERMSEDGCDAPHESQICVCAR